MEANFYIITLWDYRQVIYMGLYQDRTLAERDFATDKQRVRMRGLLTGPFSFIEAVDVSGALRSGECLLDGFDNA